VRDECMSVWLLLFGFLFLGDGDAVVTGLFRECVMVLCLKVVSFGFFCGNWACICLLIL